MDDDGLIQAEVFDPWDQLIKTCEDNDFCKSLREAKDFYNDLTEEFKKEKALQYENIKDTNEIGRIGPAEVLLDSNASLGKALFITPLMIEAGCNFFSIRANVCVFEGKWMYEVTLLTAGVQQLGWVTLDCPFDYEEGVGDYPDSFAYDGKRKKKWNVASSEYGQHWMAGDVIGVCIDLENREISYYRNGENLGVAFSEIRSKCREAVYFPALSVAESERCVLNFGASKFQYPVHGFNALHPPNTKKEIAASSLLKCFNTMNCLKQPLGPENDFAFEILSMSILRLYATSSCPSIIKDSLIPYLGELLVLSEHRFNWVIGELLNQIQPIDSKQTRKERVKDFIRQIFIQLSLNCHIAIPLPDNVERTVQSLHIAKHLLKNKTVQMAYLKSSCFNITMELFMSLKFPNAEDLEHVLPSIWLPSCKCEGQFENIEEYRSWLTLIKTCCRTVENKQVEFFKSVLDIDADTVILPWLQSIVDKYAVKYMDTTTEKPNTEVSLMDNLFFILLRVLEGLPQEHLSSKAMVKSLGSLFIHGKFSFPFLRLRGSIQHLRSAPDTSQSTVTPSQDDYIVPDVKPDLSIIKEEENIDYRDLFETVPEPVTLTAKMFNYSVLLFKLSLTRRYRYHWNCLENLSSSQKQLAVANTQIERVRESNNNPSAFLLNSRSIFLSDVKLFCRQTMWHEALLYSDHRSRLTQMFEHSLCQILTGFAAKKEFAIVPEYYLTVFLDSMMALKKCYSDMLVESQYDTAKVILEFLAHHFGDRRICNPDTKELLLFSLTKLLKNEDCLGIVEKSLTLKHIIMKKFLLAFDSRFWIGISSSLIKFWTGKTHGGFELEQDDMEIRPSPIMQQCFRDLVLSDPDCVNTFINCLFNNGSWAITELFVVLQEIVKTLADQTDLVENSAMLNNLTRKRDVMAELTVNLLHMLEIVAMDSSSLISDENVSGQINSTRMLQLVFHIIWRTVGQEAIEGFNDSSILRPVLGLLVRMYSAYGQVFLKKMVSDPGFKMKDIDLMVNKMINANKENLITISESDIESYTDFLTALKQANEVAEEEPEEEGELCHICYAFVINKKFEPCGHTSCGQCISRHLLNDKECFFCKVPVENVVDFVPTVDTPMG